ncbi:MAG: polyhydroxyalkanoic acid system family protein [Bradymonadaceae bacterium]
MKHTVEHGLSKDLAKKATEHAFDAYQQKLSDYDPQANWVTDDEAEVTFSVKGYTLEGGIHLDEDVIELELDIPMLLKPFKSKAVSVVEDEIDKWVEKARQGDLDDA